MNDEPSVRISGLTVVRGGQRVLDGLDLTLAPGRVVVLRGGNGSGKSTLLLALASVLPIASGRIDGLEGRDIAFVPQAPPRADQLPITVRQSVEMGRWGQRGLLRRLDESDREIVDEAMNALGIASIAEGQLSRTSGGQRQRALVAQALARRAPVLLMDEPTAAADARSAVVIHEAARASAADGAIVLIASHDPDAVAYADEVRTLEGGRILEEPSRVG